MPSFNHELLLRVRLDLGLTQEQAASALGVDVRTYRRYECGAVNEGGEFHVRHAARRRLLRKMCEEFGVASESEWLKAPAAEAPEAGAAAGAPGETAGPRGEAAGAPGETAGPRGEAAGPRGETAGAAGEAAGPRGETAGPRGEAGAKGPVPEPRSGGGPKPPPGPASDEGPKVASGPRSDGAPKAGPGSRADERPEASPDPGPDGAKAWQPCYAHPLQRAPHLVGRADLLASLEAWHRGPGAAPRVVAIVGVGGSGKTALVERFLRGPSIGAGGGGAFVWSFYDDTRVEALLAQALAYFAGEPSGGEGGRLERLVEALRAGPRHLLVFDGLEALQSEGGNGRALGEIDEPSLRRLVRAIAAGLGGARLLLTSRLRPADLEPWEGAEVQTLTPGELGPDESKSLLRAWGLGGDEPSLDALARRVGGHALSVAVLGSYGGAFLGGDAQRAGALVLREAARDDPRARRLEGVLGAYASSLEPLERDALARLSVFGNGAELGRLCELGAAGGPVAGALAGASEASIARALGRLERLGLVYRAGEAPARYAAHPFVREFFESFVNAPTERVHEAVRGALAARLEGRPGGRVAEPAGLDALESLFVHTLEAGRPVDAWAVYARGLGGFDNLGLRLGAMGRGARLLRRFALEASPERLRPGLSPNLAASLTYDWGLYAGALGDLELARRCYEAQGRAVASLDAGPSRPFLSAMGKRTLAYTHWLRGDLGRAAELLEASLGLAREADSAFHYTRGLALLAAIEHDRGRLARASECLELARVYDPAPVARRAFWQAELRLTQGRVSEGEALARHGLAFCEGRGWPGHVAHGSVLLGECALASGDPEGARALLERARPWALESGEVEMALRCHQLASRIALARGDAEGAGREARLGLEPADLYGFRPFAVRLRALASEAARRAGAAGRAETLAREALALADACGHAWGRADALHALGAALGRGEGARAALGEALELRERLGHPHEGETREALCQLDARLFQRGGGRCARRAATRPCLAISRASAWRLERPSSRHAFSSLPLCRSSVS